MSFVETITHTGIADVHTVETLTVPMISTIHMPGAMAIDDLIKLGLPAASWQHGGFVFADPAFAQETWLAPVAEWAAKRGYSWVRFDGFADEVKELPRFDSEWD